MIYISEAQQKVWLNHRLVTLGEQEYKLLLLLAKHHRSTVSKVDIITHIWGTKFKSDGVAVQLINKLRKRIGDQHARLIITDHSRGYQLISSVSWQPPPHVQFIRGANQWRKHYGRLALSITSLIMLAAVITTSLQHYLKHSQNKRVPQLVLASTTPAPQLEENETTSPSGDYRAHLKSNSGKLSIFDNTVGSKIHLIEGVYGFQWTQKGDYFLILDNPKGDLKTEPNSTPECNIKVFNIENFENIRTFADCSSLINDIHQHRQTDIAVSYDNQFMYTRIRPAMKVLNNDVQYVRRLSIQSDIPSQAFEINLPSSYSLVGLLTSQQPTQLIAIASRNQSSNSPTSYHAFNIGLLTQDYQYLTPIQQAPNKEFLALVVDHFLVYTDMADGLSSMHIDSTEIQSLLPAQSTAITALNRVANNKLQVSLSEQQPLLLELKAISANSQLSPINGSVP